MGVAPDRTACGWEEIGGLGFGDDGGGEGDQLQMQRAWFPGRAPWVFDEMRERIKGGYFVLKKELINT